MLPAALTTAYTVDSLVTTGRLLLLGFSIDNAHASEDCVVNFRDGAGTGAESRLVVRVKALSSKENTFGNGAIAFERGIFVDVTGGTPTVIPQYLTETRVLDILAMFDNGTRDADQFGLARLMMWLDEHFGDVALPTLTG